MLFTKGNKAVVCLAVAAVMVLGAMTVMAATGGLTRAAVAAVNDDSAPLLAAESTAYVTTSRALDFDGEKVYEYEKSFTFDADEVEGFAVNISGENEGMDVAEISGTYELPDIDGAQTYSFNGEGIENGAVRWRIGESGTLVTANAFDFKSVFGGIIESGAIDFDIVDGAEVEIYGGEGMTGVRVFIPDLLSVPSDYDIEFSFDGEKITDGYLVMPNEE